MEETYNKNALVGDEDLLEALFPNPKDRPGVRWLGAMRRRRLIPFKKIGGRIVRYDVAEVRKAIDEQFTQEAK